MNSQFAVELAMKFAMELVPKLTTELEMKFAYFRADLQESFVKRAS